MITLEELKKLGYTSGIIALMQKKNKLLIIDDRVSILDEELLCSMIFYAIKEDMSLAKRLINYFSNDSLKNYYSFIIYLIEEYKEEMEKYLNLLISDDIYSKEAKLYACILNNTKINHEDYVLKEESHAFQKTYIQLLKKYISSRDYKIAADILPYLSSKSDIIEYLILSKVFKLAKDNTKYILNNDYYPSKVTREGLYALERKLLIHIELLEYGEAKEIFDKLIFLYQFQDYLVFAIINIMFDRINEMSINKRKVSNRSLNRITGDFYSVLYELLRRNDLYRAKELLTKESSSDLITIKIFNSLMTKIMELNTRNMSFIKQEMELNIDAFKEDMPLSKKYPVSSISVNFIESLENAKENEYVNYFKRYQEEYQKGNYHEALRAIKKFQHTMKEMNISCNISCYIDELNILLVNEQVAETKSDREYFYNQGLACMKLKKYEEAIQHLKKHLNLLTIKNPMVLALIARCYQEMSLFDEAINYYLEADKMFLYPEDYLSLIDCLFKLGYYQKIPLYVSKYENYYPDQDIRLYYLLSIVYINLKDFTEAMNVLVKCEEMWHSYYNIPVVYSNEKYILRKLMNDENIPCYTIEDFVDYSLTELEEDIEKNIMQSMQEKNFIDTIILDLESQNVHHERKGEYILSIIKILTINNYIKEAKIMIKYLQKFLENKDIEANTLKRFTLALKNYKNL